MTDFIDAATGEILPGTEDNIIVAFALYMSEASRQQHWVKHNHLTKPWKASIKERMDESGGMPAWKRAIQIASKSDWLCGRIIGQKSGTRFKMSLKFLVQPNSFVSVLDGFYDNREPEPSKLVLPSMQPPHLKPQPVFVVTTTPEERMQDTVNIYRKHGRWADANRVEQKLADIQKRPAILVPAPEVAFTSGKSEGPRASAERSGANPNRITDVPDWTAEEVPMTAYGEME